MNYDDDIDRKLKMYYSGEFLPGAELTAQTREKMMKAMQKKRNSRAGVIALASLVFFALQAWIVSFIFSPTAAIMFFYIQVFILSGAVCAALLRRTYYQEVLI